jgi:hypothetical protein
MYMLNVIKAVVLPVVGLFGFVFGLFALNLDKSYTREVEAYNVFEAPKFEMCVPDPTEDGQVLLVAVDVAKCGQSVSLEVDGNVINGVVDGVLLEASFGQIQVGFIRDGKPVTALTQNQIADVTVR